MEEKQEYGLGCLGDIVFQCSQDLIRTIENVTWSGESHYETHQRACGNSLTEWTGLGPDKISFDMHFLWPYCSSPMEEITKIWTYERNHNALPLNFGSHAYGRYRWVILSHSTKINYTGPRGAIQDATVSIELQEYLNV